MACCVIASFIIAQCVATVRRWGMFWGLVSVPEGESATTIYACLRRYLNSRAGRAIVCGVILLECATFTGWLYVHHGEHIREFADVAWARLHGETVIYADLCTRQGTTHERVVLSHPPG